MTDPSTTPPPIGSLFTYRGRKYRVNSYIKKAPRPPIEGDDLLSQILRELEEEDGPPKMRLTYCDAATATHVSGSGVAGCIAPLDEITVTGMVPWPPEMIAEKARQAKRLEGREIY